ncbi:MAG: alpha-L-fucosidase [Acidimicrobiales bacterium]|jgi:alpha-L-fucosidase
MSVQQWFEGAGLGLFVHWDHASQQGIELSWPLVGKSILPGSAQVEDEVSIAQYQSSAATFDPKRWDPAGLARLARSCGARYVVLTSRHHAGFSMFHTKFSTFSIEHSPYGRDIVREFVEAVRAEGLRVGLYYSLSDWAHPNYPRFEETDKPYPRDSYRRASPKDWELYLEYVKGQITELLTNYGQIDLVWFDGDWERTAQEWDAPGIRALVRSLQPNAIVNDRLPGQGDYVTPEQGLPSERPGGPWEMCLTMNKGWGWRPSDGYYKPARRIARYLAEVAAQGGNLLLNTSPKGDGSLPEVQVARLKELGAWIASHGESVIGVEPAGPAVQFYGPVTRRGPRLYLHLVMRPTDLLTLRGVPVWRIRRVSLLGREVELAYEHNMDVHDGTDTVQDALGEVLIDAGEPTGALHDVIAIDFDRLDVP